MNWTASHIHLPGLSKISMFSCYLIFYFLLFIFHIFHIFSYISHFYLLISLCIFVSTWCHTVPSVSDNWNFNRAILGGQCSLYQEMHFNIRYMYIGPWTGSSKLCISISETHKQQLILFPCCIWFTKVIPWLLYNQQEIQRNERERERYYTSECKANKRQRKN